MSTNKIGLVVHIENGGAATQVAGWEFTGLARFGGRYLACGPDGLFVLGEGADTDAGTAIEAVVETPETDFGTARPKRLREAFVSGRTPDGPALELLTIRDRTCRAYPVPALDGQGARRCALGRDGQAVSWAVAVANLDGADFRLDSIEVAVQRLARGR
jgi:hypothetical protein